MGSLGARLSRELLLALVAAEGVGDGFEGAGEDAHVGGIGAFHGDAAAGADAFIVPLLACGKCQVEKVGYRRGRCRRFEGRWGWREGGWGGCRISLRQGYGVTRKEGAELSALRFSRRGIFCRLFTIGGEGGKVGSDSGEFVGCADGVGGDEGFAEGFEKLNVESSGGFAFAKVTA